MSQARIVLSIFAAVSLSACGGGGSDGGTNTPTPQPPPQSTIAPTVTLSADRQSALTGQPIALTWTSTGAQSCTASSAWTGAKAVTGSENVASVAGSSTYTITCENAAGSVNSSVTVSAASPVVSGVLLAPDGVTPIAGATVYAANQAASSLNKLRANRQAKDGECAAPSAVNSGSACTGADGSFSFSVSSVTGNNITLVFEKGMFRMTQTVAATETMAIGNVQLPREAAEGAPRIAVVTGSFDRIEVILAKLGLATYDADSHEIDHSTAAFTMFDGNGFGEFDDVSALFEINAATNTPRIADFDIVFVNCGADTIVLESDENLAALRGYVQNGGVLYATDWGYDFVEQPIPEYLRFAGESDANPTQPLPMRDAQIGPSEITIDATVRDPLLASWLDGVSCIGGACRNADGSIRVEGFLDGWAVMEGAHSALASVVTEHVSGIVPNVGTPDQERPLSVAFPFGEGQVIYSSYHTVHEGEDSTSFYPQERVLQYLVFEAGE